jgi:Flp pilus assembly protein TadB
VTLTTAIVAVTGLPLVLGLIAGAVGPSILLRSRAHSATRGARVGTTRVLRQTEAALRSGAGLPEAVRRATDACADRVASRPFVEALRAFDLGAPLDLALRSAAERVDDQRVRVGLETLAIGIASRLPAERAAVLVQAIADRFAFEERLDEEVRARTSGLRAQVMLLAAVVPAMAVYLALTVPSLGATLAGPLGRTILVPAAIVLEVIGIIASRRAVDGVLR